MYNESRTQYQKLEIILIPVNIQLIPNLQI